MRQSSQVPRRVVLLRTARKLHSRRQAQLERCMRAFRLDDAAHRYRHVSMARYAARLAEQDPARRKAKAARRQRQEGKRA